MAAQDPYTTLGVSRTASQDDIKNAYRELAKKYHPDLNPGNKRAELKFKEINQAYELIGTPEARKKFDRGEFAGGAGAGFGAGAGAGAGPFYYRTQEEGFGGGRYSFGEDFGEDLFEAIFGRARQAPPKEPRESRQQVYSLEIDLRDAVLGAEKEIVLPDGRRLSVKIPPGIHSGTRLRFAGAGIYVEIKVRPSERFKPEAAGSNNLVIELPISLAEAVVGGEVRVPTPEGAVMLRIPSGVNTGTRLKIAGKGLYDRSTRRRGDQIVVLRVLLPDRSDPGWSELETAIREWSKHYPYRPKGRVA